MRFQVVPVAASTSSPYVATWRLDVVATSGVTSPVAGSMRSADVLAHSTVPSENAENVVGGARGDVATLSRRSAVGESGRTRHIARCGPAHRNVSFGPG